MYIKTVIFSYILLCFINFVRPWHIKSRQHGEMKQQARAKGVFHIGQIPASRQNRGKVYVFTNPPTIPTTTPKPPPTTTTVRTKPTTHPLIVIPKQTGTTQAFNWEAYFATTYPSTKKGQCPDYDVVHGSCYGRCHSDDDCFYERKCCRDGYGFGCCVDPVQPGMFGNLFGNFFGPTTGGYLWKKK